MLSSDFKMRVREAVRDRDGRPLFNATLDHASILTEAMFANANDYIWILSGKLNARVYGRSKTVEEAKLFLVDPNHKLRILVENGSKESLKDNPLFTLCEEKENAEVRLVPEKMSKRYDFHAWVMDNNSYRFEEDKTKPEAIAAFGDEDGAQNIKELFKTIWKESEQLSH